MQVERWDVLFRARALRMNGKYKAPVTSAATTIETTIRAVFNASLVQKALDTCPRPIRCAYIVSANGTVSQLSGAPMSRGHVSSAFWTGFMS